MQIKGLEIRSKKHDARLDTLENQISLISQFLIRWEGGDKLKKELDGLRETAELNLRGRTP